MARAVANISSVEPEDGDGDGGEDVDAVDEVGVTLMKADGIKLLIGTLDTEDITGATTPRFFVHAMHVPHSQHHRNNSAALCNICTGQHHRGRDVQGEARVGVALCGGCAGALLG